MLITILKITLFILMFCFSIILEARIVINEIMPAPLDGEPEWIEFYNTGEFEIILVSPAISDLASSRNIQPFKLQPGQFAIVVKDTNLLKTYYNIPSNCIMIQSTFPTLNNTNDAVALRENVSELIDTVFYDMKWGEKGLSLERIDVKSAALSQTNWSKSLSAFGATPGYINSTALINYDLTCLKINYNNLSAEVEVVINDIGTKRSQEFDFSVNAEFTISSGEMLNLSLIELTGISIYDLDTIISIPVELIRNIIPRSGMVRFTAFVSSFNDERRSNDTVSSEFYIRREDPIIKINEIMYDVSDGMAEYIELWNGGSDTLLLDNFVIWDAAGTIEKGNVRIISDSFVIPPNEYGVVTWDEAFFQTFPDLLDKNNIYLFKSSMNLNLSGDLIVIADANGKIYDSLTYSNSWHNRSVSNTKNRSLEKISPILESHYNANWSTCSAYEGGTPGKINSLAGNKPGEGSISISPNPFAPSLGGADANAVISYELPFTSSHLSAAVYDMNGTRISQIANNRFSGSQGAIVWDGRNSNDFISQIGQYIVVIEAVDIESGKVSVLKSLIVIGK
ncbi:MAG: lamin tail domain-containing protein [Candidatus Kapabacteria bacterium]|nr:lamin tail domain-containing protein [Ignavibacteriota bacterium]MCW5885174.1 lamin tail domain-containing protein [Candidatus Kapabacteria bacterium]